MLWKAISGIREEDNILTALAIILKTGGKKQ